MEAKWKRFLRNRGLRRSTERGGSRARTAVTCAYAAGAVTSREPVRSRKAQAIGSSPISGSINQQVRALERPPAHTGGLLLEAIVEAKFTRSASAAVEAPHVPGDTPDIAAAHRA